MKASWIAPLSVILLTACEQTAAPVARTQSQTTPAVVYTPPPSRVAGQKYVELPFPPLAPEPAAAAPDVGATAAATEEASEDLGPQLQVVLVPYPDPYPVEVPYYVESYYDQGYYSAPYGPFYYYPSYGGGYYYGYGGGFYISNIGGYPGYGGPGHGGPGHGGPGHGDGGMGGRGGGGRDPIRPHPEHPIYNMGRNNPPAAPVTVAPLTPPPMAPHPAQMQMAMKAPRSGIVPPNPVYLQPGQAMNPTLPIYTTGAGQRPIQVMPHGTIPGPNMMNARGYAPPIAIPGQGSFASEAPPSGAFVPPQAAVGTGSGRAAPYINAAPPAYGGGGGPAMGLPGPMPSGGGGMIGGGPFYSSPPIGNMGGPIVPAMRTGR